MKSFVYRFVGLAALLVAVGSCGGKDGANPLDAVRQACGLVCPGQKIGDAVLEGIEQGNTSISGVAEVDAFFSAVLTFETAADGVSGAIQTQLDAIKADFGITSELAAGLKTQFEANLQSKLEIDYQPAQCSVDAQATLEASAKCDASVSGGKAEVECKGSCEAQVSAKVECDASAELYCTVTAPSVKCEGQCKGSCDVEFKAAATCEGSCNGKCDGTCSSFSDKEGTQCNGRCSGMCTGHCETEFAAKAECSGSCTGECTAKPATADCSGAVRAECRAKGDASFKCSAGCTGEFEPPKVKAECEATAKAQASVNVQCTPPQLAVNYGLKASADLKFQAALKSLIDVRLPALYQAVGKGNLVAKAGEGLGVAATGAVEGAANALKAKAGVSLKTLNGVACAVQELPKAKSIVTDAAGTLNARLLAVKSVNDAIGLGS